MSVAALALAVAEVMVRLTDEAPEPEDVKAGWTAFAIFLLLAGAVVVLGFSLVKQLRRAEAAKDAGLYGDVPQASEESAQESAEESDGSGQPDPSDRRPA